MSFTLTGLFGAAKGKGMELINGRQAPPPSGPARPQAVTAGETSAQAAKIESRFADANGLKMHYLAAATSIASRARIGDSSTLG